MSRGWLLQRSPHTRRNENKWADAGMNNPLLDPLARGARALWNWGHQTCGPVVTYVAYLWFLWRWEDSPPPIITTNVHAYHYHITDSTKSHIRLHIQRMQHKRLRTPCNVKIFPKCQLISAALECLHKLNMFINTFFSVGETWRDGRIINQEVCCALPVNHSAHSWMHSSNNNSARCS